MFFRKVIYMGECGEGAVYFDTERNLALVAPQSMLLNTAGAGKTNLLIPGLIALGFGGTGLTVANPFGGHYSEATLVFLIIAWTVEFFGLVWLLERVLYKNVKRAQPTTRENFRLAVYGNLIWNNFGDKRATTGKKIWLSVLLSAILIANIGIVPIVYKMILPLINNREQIGSEIIMISLMGTMPFSLVLLVWQNNPIRWLNVVEKYQKRQIKWGKKT
ncbi:hypothetical protein BU202_01960 [Streptococcus cuniculi]|uniref:Uncharacterized protein n=1 Tax=Streptococcus cuniculi TaxID=1432788 RepID=A0A1Q8E9D5_9STRE|nr:hypothetical protein [Streptococcus cuniculi]OLF48407.1 hypothetical protein BU202_01960 [Streptococcus cuniculi]